MTSSRAPSFDRAAASAPSMRARSPIAPSLGTAILFALLACGASPALAQRGASRAVTTRSLDVIGPRSASSVRAWLGRNARTLDACRGAAASVSLTFAVAPDGGLVEVRAREGEDLDPAASACVRGLVLGWRMPGRASSVTTVVWTLALAELRASCFCFHWIHGGDFGISCEPARAACEREIETIGREHTDCEPMTRPRCDDEATIDGRRMRHD